eukprot:scaffold3428_cov379-Prasinococcus_capsulatus_cf.AAC.15
MADTLCGFGCPTVLSLMICWAKLQSEVFASVQAFVAQLTRRVQGQPSFAHRSWSRPTFATPFIL